MTADQEYLEHNLRKAEIPAGLREWTIGSYLEFNPASRAEVDYLVWKVKGPEWTVPADELVDQWRRWAAGKRSLYLHNPFGGYRTNALAVGLLKRYLEEGPGKFIAVDDLLGRIREGLTRGNYRAQDELLEQYKTVRCLVLADIGAEHYTKWARDKLELLIGYRHRHKLTTIFTSNYSQRELGDRLGAPIVGRIFEMAEDVKVSWSNVLEQAAEIVDSYDAAARP